MYTLLNATVAFGISTEDGGEFTFKTFICHKAPPSLRFQTNQLHMWIIRVSAGIRLEKGFDSENGEPLEISKILQKLVKRIYIQIDGFSSIK